jgi:hypothetical protein
VNRGKRCGNNPDCSVEVVDATVMNRSCAVADITESATASKPAMMQAKRRIDSSCEQPNPMSPLSTVKVVAVETVTPSIASLRTQPGAPCGYCNGME